MTDATIQKRIMNLEAELILLKKAVAKESIDFDIDEKNWAKIRPLMKRIRAKVYKETYGRK